MSGRGDTPRAAGPEDPSPPEGATSIMRRPRADADPPEGATAVMRRRPASGTGPGRPEPVPPPPGRTGRAPRSPEVPPRRTPSAPERPGLGVTTFLRARSAPDGSRPPKIVGRESATTWLTYAKDEAAAPVFVDGSGRRKLLWRLVGALIALVCVAFVAVIVIAAVSGSPVLPGSASTTTSSTVGAPPAPGP